MDGYSKDECASSNIKNDVVKKIAVKISKIRFSTCVHHDTSFHPHINQKKTKKYFFENVLEIGTSTAGRGL